MRWSVRGVAAVLLLAARSAWGQVPIAPAAEPAPSVQAPPAAAPGASAPTPSEPPTSTSPSAAADAPAAAEVTPAEAPAPAEAAPAEAPAPTPAPAEVGEPSASTVVAPPPPATDKPAEAWQRARSPLTLEAKLGFSLRPDSGNAFDSQSNAGAEVGASLYFELKRELALGLDIERTSLGRGTGLIGLNSISVDYSASSAMLGLRAYPKRTELVDLFVGFQVGVGVQGVSAAGTASNGGVARASTYTCSASDVPAFQIGGTLGARLMLTPRWGVTARVNGVGRRLTDEMIEDCAPGLGTLTSVSAGLGVGYDFDLEP